MENNQSSAIRPIIEAPYPQVKWAYTDFFAYAAHKWFGSEIDPTTRFDENNNVTGDEVRWRDYSIHITPQKRFEAARQRGFPGFSPDTLVSATRAHSDSDVFTTIDTRVVFQIKELVYPGDKAIAVEGKWIYAFHLNALTVLAEVFAESANKWLFRYNPTFPANASVPPPDKICDGKLELPSVKADESPTNIGFYISPFRLTSDAIKFLLEDGERLKAACVRPVRESAQMLFAAVPDPYQWTTDAHEKYYIPLLDEWQNYIFNPQRQAKLFIATTLKAWINSDDKGLIYDSKDPLDIEDELKSGEPDWFLNRYKQEEEQLSIKAEKAGAYLYHCVSAPEHRAAEKAALESKDSALTLTFQNWAVVCERATETAQGRMFAINAFNDKTRLPNKYLFSEDAPESLPDTLKSYFPNTRYAWAAAIAIVGEFLPAVIKDITNKNVRPQIYEKMIGYLERIGIEKAGMKIPKGMPKYLGDKAGKTLYQQLKQNKDITEGLTHKRTIKRVEELYEKVLKESDADIIKNMGDDSVNAFTKRYNESLVGRNRLKIAFVFETINVVLAIAEFSSSNQKAEWNNDKFVSLLGASADFASVFVEPAFKNIGLEEMTVKQLGGESAKKLGFDKAGKVALGRAVGGVAGIVGGICQMTDEQRQAVEGYGQYDFGVAAGHGIAAAGAAMTAVGGGLILAEAIGGGTAVGGPFGAAIGAVGAGLIIGGNLLAVWLKDRPHEQFARFCFLGKQYDTVAHQVYELNETVANYNPLNKLVGRQPYHRTPLYTEWSSEGGIPTDDILKEARLLMWLLSSFQIELEQERAGNPANGNDDRPEAFIKIIPGYLPPSAKIEIRLEQTYTHRHGYNPQEKFEATMIFDQMTDEISYLHGNLIPLKKHNEVKRDNLGNIEYIKFAIRPEQVKFDNKTLPFDVYLDYNKIYRYPQSSVVKARVSMGRVFQPSASQYLQIKTLEEAKVSSADNSKWTA
jgi:hypothetical protein